MGLSGAGEGTSIRLHAPRCLGARPPRWALGEAADELRKGQTMAKLSLTVATWDYDRVRPLIDGRVQVEGCDINFVKVPPEECFHRAWNHQEFDVTEIGLSGYIIG